MALYDYVNDVWLPLLHRLGISAMLTLARTGWFPVGRGEIAATIQGAGRHALPGLDQRERGRLLRICGRAIAANLPAHIHNAWSTGRGHCFSISAGAGLFLRAAPTLPAQAGT